MHKMTYQFFHDASFLVSVGVFLMHRFETVGVFTHFLCVKNALCLELCPSKGHQTSYNYVFGNVNVSARNGNFSIPLVFSTEKYNLITVMQK